MVFWKKKKIIDASSLSTEEQVNLVCEHVLHRGFHYEKVNTGIGEVHYAVCDKCRVRINITDYDSW